MQFILELAGITSTPATTPSNKKFDHATSNFLKGFEQLVYTRIGFYGYESKAYGKYISEFVNQQKNMLFNNLLILIKL